MIDNIFENRSLDETSIGMKSVLDFKEEPLLKKMAKEASEKKVKALKYETIENVLLDYSNTEDMIKLSDMMKKHFDSAYKGNKNKEGYQILMMEKFQYQHTFKVAITFVKWKVEEIMVKFPGIKDEDVV